MNPRSIEAARDVIEIIKNVCEETFPGKPVTKLQGIAATMAMAAVIDKHSIEPAIISILTIEFDLGERRKMCQKHGEMKINFKPMGCQACHNDFVYMIELSAKLNTHFGRKIEMIANLVDPPPEETKQ